MKKDRKMKHSRQHFFTLVELITVMILMGILLVVTLPSFNNLTKGHILTHAAQEVAGQISIARSYALANHCYMAVVFPTMDELHKLDGSSSLMDSSPLASYYNTSCRIALVIKNSDDEYEFVMWKPDSNWVLLPEGSVIPEEDVNFRTMSKKLKNVRLGDLSRLYTQSPKDNVLQKTLDISRYIIIRPNGQLVIDGNTTSVDGDNSILIRVTDGGFNPLTGKIEITKRNNSVQVYQGVKIDPLTGRSELVELE